MPELTFSKVSDFKQFCDANKLDPTIDLLPKKHSNMRGEFFHELKGQMSLNGMTVNFSVEEHLVKKDKLFKREEGYLLSELN